jgi:hypothetical protein
MPFPSALRSPLTALWITLLLYGAVAAPVPGVNEPHYLGKAKHFWDAGWCAGDLLYESSNAHAVFFFVTGYWAKWLSLTQLAWVGRAIGYGLLARGWQRAHQVLGIEGDPAWWSLVGFLMLASFGNLSGEWLVGGIEGKVFSYGFLLLAFADWQSDRLFRAALWAGLGISFHPVVGGWAVLAALLAGVGSLRTCKHSWRTLIGALGVMILASLPGLIPAVQVIAAPDSPDVRLDGTYLQVYYRLKHHLDPMTFSWRSWTGYGVLLVLTIALHRRLISIAAGRTWLWIVFWAGIFALAGLLAGWGPRPAKEMPYYLERMYLLKFYPFRLFDVLLPMTAAMEATRAVSGWLSSQSLATQRWSAVLAGILLFAGIAGGEWRRAQLHKPTVFDSPEWVDVCEWIKQHTSPKALVQTPVYNQNFKWHAERAEYVAYKDVPQDNAGLVEWNRRMRFLDKWYREHRQDGVYSHDELRQLRAETGITHVLTDRLGPFESRPRYTNGRFRVYDLTELDLHP